MKAFIRKNQWFLGPYLVLLLLAVYLLLSTEKGHLVLFFNSMKTEWFEGLFTGLTYLGDGILATVICLAFLFVSKRYVLILAPALLLNTLVIQGLKYLIQAPRPRKFFENIHILQENRFTDSSYMLSMPSGHTALAFCLFGILAFLSRKSTMGYVYLCLAVAVGISRIVLAQHFLEDIVAGSFIGTAIAMLVVILGKRYMPENTSFDKPFITWKR